MQKNRDMLSFVQPGPLRFFSTELSQKSNQNRRYYKTRRTFCASLETGARKQAEVRYTSLANNTFTLEYNGVRLLVDPWLEDDLIFFTPKFFRSVKSPRARGLSKAGRFDAVVLTQHLPDHAHEPTLRCMPRNTPVVAPSQALSLLKSLGFTNVQVIDYGDVIAPVPSAPSVTISAGRGSVVGPPGSPPQLALVFSFAKSKDDERPLTVYHEPHGNHDPQFLEKHRGKLDAAIGPIIDTKLPILGNYALVNGIPEALDLCRRARPKAFVGFDNSGGEQSGFLVRFLKQNGGIQELKEAVKKENDLKDMKILFPPKEMQEITIASESGRVTETTFHSGGRFSSIAS